MRYEITGKYGDAISLSDIPVPTGTEGYEFAGWDKAVPTTFGNDDGIIKTEIKATYKLKKMTITYRLVNLDTNKVLLLLFMSSTRLTVLKAQGKRLKSALRSQ